MIYEIALITVGRYRCTYRTLLRTVFRLFASFWGQAVDPLVGFGAGHVRERLAEAVLQALDAVLASPLDGQRLQEVDLALSCLAGPTPLRGGRFLRLPIRG